MVRANPYQNEAALRPIQIALTCEVGGSPSEPRTDVRGHSGHPVVLTEDCRRARHVLESGHIF